MSERWARKAGSLYQSGALAQVPSPGPPLLLVTARTFGWLWGPAVHLLQGTMALPGAPTVSQPCNLDLSPFRTPKVHEMTPLSGPPLDLNHLVSRESTRRGQRQAVPHPVLRPDRKLHGMRKHSEAHCPQGNGSRGLPGVRTGQGLCTSYIIHHMERSPNTTHTLQRRKQAQRGKGLAEAAQSRAYLDAVCPWTDVR